MFPRRPWLYLEDDDGAGSGAGGDGGGDDGGSGDGGAGGGSDSGDSGRELEKARREAAGLRKRLEAAEKERDELKKAGETEKERAERERDEARKASDGAVARLRRASLKAEVGLQVRDLGIVNAKAAHRLIDEDAIKYDDEGEVEEESVTKALKAAVKEYPFLTRAGSADGGEGGGNGGSGGAVGKDAVGKGLNAALRRARK
jgi:hypothetical protein